MFSEQLAVLLLIAASQIGNQGGMAQPVAQVPRNGVERVSLSATPGQKIKAELRSEVSLAANSAAYSVNLTRPRSLIKREREAMMLAEFR
jgi:hypothetical protein